MSTKKLDQKIFGMWTDINRGTRLLMLQKTGYGYNYYMENIFLNYKKLIRLQYLKIKGKP